MQTDFNEHCENGCINGSCKVVVGQACTEEGKTEMRDDGKCLVSCQNGTYASTSPCDHIEVISYNNFLRRSIYEVLSKLPEYMFAGLNETIRQEWTPVVQMFNITPGGFALNYINLGVSSTPFFKNTFYEI